MTLLKKRTFFLCLLTSCLKGVNCRLGDVCEDEKAFCVADMLSTHVWLHVALFLLSQNPRLRQGYNPGFAPTLLSHSIFILSYWFAVGGWGDPWRTVLSCSFDFPETFQRNCVPDPKPFDDSENGF